MSKTEMIYLDHAAATPVCKEATLAMQPYFADLFFNPSSPYLPAKKVKGDYEAAKDEIAHAIGAKGTDLVMTSGATEAINLALSLATKEILYLATEHASVKSAAEAKNGKAIKVLPSGLIDLNDLKSKITDQTEIVAVSLANNETGTIQPISEIAEIIKTERENRLASNNPTPIYLLTDASQALNLLDISVTRIGADMLVMNSAKIGGPKGVGALYLAHGVKVTPQILGGGQERGLRSGTENVAGTIGFAAAIKTAKSHLKSNRKKYEALTKILKDSLKKYDPIFPGTEKSRLANFCPVILKGLDAERLIFMLEDQNIYLSTGAACAANKGQASHVLKAMGYTDTEISGSLRISLGVLNDEENIKLAAEKICEAIDRELERLNK